MTKTLEKVTGAIAVMLLLSSCWCRAESIDQIIFLHLRLKDGVVTLVRSSVAPGRLKSPIASEKKGAIQLELTTMDGASLWTEVIEDPAFQRLEYEDPENPGKFKVKEVRVTEVEFSVRLPFHQNARHLKLYRLEKPANRRVAAVAGTGKTLLGIVAVSTTEGTK